MLARSSYIHTHPCLEILYKYQKRWYLYLALSNSGQSKHRRTNPTIYNGNMKSSKHILLIGKVMNAIWSGWLVSIFILPITLQCLKESKMLKYCSPHLAILFFSFSITILCIMGIPNASVLPVPVFALAIRSRPCIAGSSTALCRNQYHHPCHYLEIQSQLKPAVPCESKPCQQIITPPVPIVPIPDSNFHNSQSHNSLSNSSHILPTKPQMFSKS